MNQPRRSGRLSILAAALVVARRDFVAVLFSRSFFFFLLGPLFPVIVGGLAGGIGASVREQRRTLLAWSPPSSAFPGVFRACPSWS
jgi:hypothetical protein